MSIENTLLPPPYDGQRHVVCRSYGVWGRRGSTSELQGSVGGFYTHTKLCELLQSAWSEMHSPILPCDYDKVPSTSEIVTAKGIGTWYFRRTEKTKFEK